MPRFGNDKGRGATWARLAVVTVIAGALMIAAQGCCSRCPQPVTHSIAFAVDTTKCPCPDADCVCPVPEVIKVHRGDKVQFVNASPYDVKVTPSVEGAFNETSPIEVDSKTVATVTVSDDVEVDVEIRLNMEIADPGKICPGLPGPRMGVERG